MSRLDDLIAEGRGVIGAPYVYWGGGPLEEWVPMYTNAPGVGPGYVMGHGVNCSGLLNYALTRTGTEPVGGTLRYGEVLNPWESFDPSRWYPVGTVCVDEFVAGVSEGHMGIVSRPNQLMLQSDAYRGVNETKTAAEQHGYSPFAWAGWLPGLAPADHLPGWTIGGVAGYPGDEATLEETAAWMARVAYFVYGLPPELPIIASLVALTQAWTGPGDVRSVPGYLYAVDHDSLGWFQQRPTSGWGTPEQLTNAEYALSAFLDAAWRLGPYPPYPTDAGSLGAWCRKVQRSAYSHRYTRMENGTVPLEWARKLLKNNPDYPGEVP